MTANLKLYGIKFQEGFVPENILQEQQYILDQYGDT